MFFKCILPFNIIIIFLFIQHLGFLPCVILALSCNLCFIDKSSVVELLRVSCAAELRVGNMDQVGRSVFRVCCLVVLVGSNYSITAWGMVRAVVMTMRLSSAIILIL